MYAFSLVECEGASSCTPESRVPWSDGHGSEVIGHIDVSRLAVLCLAFSGLLWLLWSLGGGIGLWHSCFASPSPSVERGVH